MRILVACVAHMLPFSITPCVDMCHIRLDHLKRPYLVLNAAASAALDRCKMNSIVPYPTKSNRKSSRRISWSRRFRGTRAIPRSFYRA